MAMEGKYIVSSALIITGSAVLGYGAITAKQSYINLGMAGVFLGLIVLTFKSSEYVKREALDNLTSPYIKTLQELVRDLALEGRAVYIPPYENLPDGGTFIPLHEEFDLDLARLDEETVFLTNVSNERQMGLKIRPLGLELLKKYEEHLEHSLEGTGYSTVESASSSVLRVLDLARGVYIDEENGRFRIVVNTVNREICRRNVGHCDQVACPICSSVLLSLAKATGELIMADKFSITEHGIEIEAKRVGGVGNWM